MSETHEQPEATQQETQATQADTEGRVEPTRECGGSLAVRYPFQGGLCDQAPCEPIGVGATGPSCTGPDREAILEQYAVLTATLAGPTGGVDLSQLLDVEVEDGKAKVRKPVIEKTDIFGRIKKINFPGAGGALGAQKPFACNFFAPMPLSAPVNWPFPTPQPLLGFPSFSLTSCQPCLEETCDPCGPNLGNCFDDFDLLCESAENCNNDGTRTVTFTTDLKPPLPTGTFLQARWDFGDGKTGVPFTIPPDNPHQEHHSYVPSTTPYTATLEFLPAVCSPITMKDILVEQCEGAPG